MMIYQLAMQTVDGAKEILELREVTIIGVLVLINFALASAVVYLYKKNEKMSDIRLADQKEFTKELLNITEKTTNTVRQVNEILKITKGNV
jgi:hypothetical protein